MTTEPTEESGKWGEELNDTKTRREFMMLLGLPGENDEWTALPVLTDGLDEHATFALAIRALAREVCQVGLDLQAATNTLD